MLHYDFWYEPECEMWKERLRQEKKTVDIANHAKKMEMPLYLIHVTANQGPPTNKMFFTPRPPSAKNKENEERKENMNENKPPLTEPQPIKHKPTHEILYGINQFPPQAPPPIRFPADQPALTARIPRNMIDTQAQWKAGLTTARVLPNHHLNTPRHPCLFSLPGSNTFERALTGRRHLISTHDARKHQYLHHVYSQSAPSSASSTTDQIPPPPSSDNLNSQPQSQSSLVPQPPSQPQPRPPSQPRASGEGYSSGSQTARGSYVSPRPGYYNPETDYSPLVSGRLEPVFEYGDWKRIPKPKRKVLAEAHRGIIY